MREYVLRFNTNSDITTVIETGASNRFVFVILILFEAFVNNWESVNFNIYLPSFLVEEEKKIMSLLNPIHLTVLRGLELQLH